MSITVMNLKLNTRLNQILLMHKNQMVFDNLDTFAGSLSSFIKFLISFSAHILYKSVFFDNIFAINN